MGFIGTSQGQLNLVHQHEKADIPEYSWKLSLLIRIQIFYFLLCFFFKDE